MPEEKKGFLEGYRKVIVGLVAMAVGVWLISTGHPTEGVTIFLAGLTAVCGGTIADKLIKKK